MNGRSQQLPLALLLSCTLVAPGWGAPTAFRITTLQLMDPHLFTSLAGCVDITAPAFNDPMRNRILGDLDSDGILDFSQMIVFDPLDQAGGGGSLTFTRYNCSAPAPPAVCFPDPSAPSYSFSYSNVKSGIGLAPIPGTTNSSYGTIGSTPAPCFVTDPHTVLWDLGGGWNLTLHDMQIAAQYKGDPAGELAGGLIRGFLTQEDAEATFLPLDLPIIGGMSLSQILPGGGGNCAGFSDKDTDPSGKSGWYFYLNFTATASHYDETPVTRSTWGSLKTHYR